MGQPVRKQIKEAHPDAGVESIYTLLVDGGSLLRQSFKDNRVNTRGIHYGGVFQFLLQLRMIMQKKDFNYVYVFFDAHDSGILRYEIYPAYKANRDKDYAEHSNLSDYMKEYNATIARMQNYLYKKKEKPVKELTPEEKVTKENFDRERDILCKYFNELYIRWMIDEKTEGDDLISYYVHHKLPNEKIVIMSADEDLTQLISETVCVYNNIKKKFFSNDNFKQLKGYPHENVVLKKVFCGDKSDNIGNVDGVSETRLFELMPEIHDRPVTINEVRERAKEMVEKRIAEKKKPLKWHENIVNGVSRGNYPGDFYEINERIINLDKPLLTPEAETELSEMIHNVQDPEGRSFENLYSYMLEDGIDELSDSDRFAFFFEPFKVLIDKEIREYKKEMLK
jgi:5'-3' exonuclease